MELSGRSEAAHVVLSQLVATLVLSLLLLSFGSLSALSALLGGGIATLTNWAAASKIFVPYQAQRPGLLVARFYGAEIRKILLTLLLFGVVAVAVPTAQMAALFGIYFVVQTVPILVVQFRSLDPAFRGQVK